MAEVEQGFVEVAPPGLVGGDGCVGVGFQNLKNTHLCRLAIKFQSSLRTLVVAHRPGSRAQMAEQPGCERFGQIGFERLAGQKISGCFQKALGFCRADLP